MQRPRKCASSIEATANLRTKILDFRGFDSRIILILRGGVLMSIGDFPESLSQQILAGTIFFREIMVYPYIYIYIHMYIYIYIYI